MFGNASSRLLGARLTYRLRIGNPGQAVGRTPDPHVSPVNQPSAALKNIYVWYRQTLVLDHTAVWRRKRFVLPELCVSSIPPSLVVKRGDASPPSEVRAVPGQVYGDAIQLYSFAIVLYC